MLQQAPALVTEPFRLTVVKAPSPLQGLTLTPHTATVVIGRGAECDLRLDHPTVSRRHARVRCENGAWEVEDLGSRNGILLNGRVVREARLNDGDALGFGHEITARFSLVNVGPAKGIAAAMPMGEGTDHETHRLRLQHERAAADRRVAVVRVRGRVDGFTYSDLRDCLAQALETGVRGLVIDLSECPFFDHAGLGVLVNVQTQLARTRGQLLLIGAAQRLMEGIELLRLTRLIRVAANEDEAVAELQRVLD